MSLLCSLHLLTKAERNMDFFSKFRYLITGKIGPVIKKIINKSYFYNIYT